MHYSCLTKCFLLDTCAAIKPDDGIIYLEIITDTNNFDTGKDGGGREGGFNMNGWASGQKKCTVTLKLLKVKGK